MVKQHLIEEGFLRSVYPLPTNQMLLNHVVLIQLTRSIRSLLLRALLFLTLGF